MRALIATSLIAAVAAAQAGDQRAAIDYYLQDYDGADIALSRFHCGAPYGLRSAEERAAWLGCYDRFLASYRAALPVGRSIPAEVAEAMSEAELAAAHQRMNQVFVQIARQARLQAEEVRSGGVPALSQLEKK